MNGFIVSKHRQPRHQANAILSFSCIELNAGDKATTFFGLPTVYLFFKFSN